MAEADPQKTFEVHDAVAYLPRLADRAHAGEEIVLARDGEPWARIVPVAAATGRRQPGGFRLSRPLDLTGFLEPPSEEDLAYIDDRPEHERR